EGHDGKRRSVARAGVQPDRRHRRRAPRVPPRSMNAPPLLCAAVEVALNRYLALESSALAACADMQGRAIELRTEAPDWSFFVEFHAGGVRVAPDCERAADVRVSGRASTLMRLAWTVAQGQD